VAPSSESLFETSSLSAIVRAAHAFLGSRVQASVVGVLAPLGIALRGSPAPQLDCESARSCYVHHTAVPVALLGYTLASSEIARAKFQRWSLSDVVRKRPFMDEYEATALAAIAGVEVSPPYWGNGGPFGKQLWNVITRYELGPLFERVSRPYGTAGDHFFMRPRGMAWEEDGQRELPDVMLAWRASYRKLPLVHQMMAVTILNLYSDSAEAHWMRGLRRRWNAVDSVLELDAKGALVDWARLMALYPGW